MIWHNIKVVRDIVLLLMLDKHHKKCILPSLPWTSTRCPAKCGREQQHTQATTRSANRPTPSGRSRMNTPGNVMQKTGRKTAPWTSHESICNMIKNCINNRCWQGGGAKKGLPLPLKLKESHGGLDIQLHQLFEEAGQGDAGFPWGVLANFRAGNFTRGPQICTLSLFPFLLWQDARAGKHHQQG